MGDKWFESEGALFQGEGITLNICKTGLAWQVLLLFMKSKGQILSESTRETCIINSAPTLIIEVC